MKSKGGDYKYAGEYINRIREDRFKNDKAHRKLGRIFWGNDFADDKDLGVYLTYRRCYAWPVECVVPENRISSSDRYPVPVLWTYGKKDVMTGIGDMKSARKNFPRSEFAVFDQSACMPFIEENAKFTEIVKDFLARNATGQVTGEGK